ncbi:stage II sporulation protein R [Pueribacillus theae]|uniref:Stage II sporulation protein R n=1 Tax=Pueribacillus theae TaxID=2171751 RepID=A0A2U1K2Y3_9BACI|nr:stage II sporulation protein R [Pueribacillus theae]PWA11890.1 stage II sporulation protein R [Pueribacillus theae]
MKREAIIFLFLSISLLFSSIQPSVGYRQLESSVIPDDAIRLRILANSNSQQDQEIKRQIRDAVRTEIESWVENYRSVEKARKVINSHLPEIKEIVANELKKAGLHTTFSVQLGTFSFPTKLYGSFIYPAGDYEAVLITLGEGLGANWWCVLFPPLCFIDIDSGEAIKEDDPNKDLPAEQKEEPKDPEIKFFIVDLLSNLWTFLKNLL